MTVALARMKVMMIWTSGMQRCGGPTCGANGEIRAVLISHFIGTEPGVALV